MMRVRALILLLSFAAFPAFAAVISPNLIKGGSFDDAAALNNWTRTTPRVIAEWNGVDALARPASGSAQILGRTPSGISQCVQVFATHDYEFGARVYTARSMTLFRPPRLMAYATLQFLAAPGCKGAQVAEASTERTLLGPSGRFVAIGGSKQAPVGAESALLTLWGWDEAAPSAFTPAAVMFDDVFVRDSGGCVPDHRTLCFADGTLRARAKFFDASSAPVDAEVIQISPSSGYFYSYSPDDAEMTIKTIDLSSGGQPKWVVVGGMTNLKLEITVEDLAGNRVRKYTNPAGRFFSPIVDPFPAN